ncbi:MAG: hypothetical protein MJ252_13355 [archaeon]|nr:hypothetical protein [archaeon]
MSDQDKTSQFSPKGLLNHNINDSNQNHTNMAQNEAILTKTEMKMEAKESNLNKISTEEESKNIK